MKINEKQFDMAVKIITNQINKKILFMLYKDNTLTYSEIKDKSGFDKTRNESGKFAYYIRRLKDRNIIKKDGKYYFLTRLGLQITKLVYDLQEICMEYDLSDCDADGKIMVIVKRK